MKLGAVGDTQNETERHRRRRAVKLSVSFVWPQMAQNETMEKEHSKIWRLRRRRLVKLSALGEGV
jgi:hypothetical protein